MLNVFLGLTVHMMVRALLGISVFDVVGGCASESNSFNPGTTLNWLVDTHPHLNNVHQRVPPRLSLTDRGKCAKCALGRKAMGGQLAL